MPRPWSILLAQPLRYTPADAHANQEAPVKTATAQTRTANLDAILTAAFVAHLYILCATGCLLSLFAALQTVA